MVAACKQLGQRLVIGQRGGELLKQGRFGGEAAPYYRQLG